MSRLAWLGLVGVTLVAVAVANGCQGPETFLRKNFSVGTGGVVTGGDGGSIDHGSGGSTGTGGAPGGTGGRPGTGGTQAGSGGSGAGGTLAGTGGRGTGGRGSGGMRGTGGDLGGTGGDLGGTGGATPDGGDGAVSTGTCIGDIPVFGYTSLSGPPCSECHDNDTKLESACKVMIDCLVPIWPTTQGSGPWLNCLHKAQGSGVVESCVVALTMACQ